MARTSHKQQNPSLSQSYTEKTALYNVAIYARLSVEDNGKNSDSIESQISYLEDYIAKDPPCEKLLFSSTTVLPARILCARNFSV